jgi:hypothetical protein
MMTVSLGGVLRKSARFMDAHGEDTGLSFMLDELLKHLKELRDRKAEGEKVIDEFFTLYTQVD